MGGVGISPHSGAPAPTTSPAEVIALDPSMPAAYTNLAALLRAKGDEPGAERSLHAAATAFVHQGVERQRSALRSHPLQ